MLFRLTIAATVVGAAVGQVCDTYDGGATSFGADPSLGTFILLIFMGALVMCTCQSFPRQISCTCNTLVSHYSVLDAILSPQKTLVCYAHLSVWVALQLCRLGSR
jgi:hypothetical protein